MRVKIFEGFGSDGAKTVERNLNEWLEMPNSRRGQTPNVIDMKVATTPVGPTDDRFQHIVVVVMYQEDQGV